MNDAQLDDAGASAAREVLGCPLEEFVTAILGEGDWAPDPAKWRDGTAQGQFREMQA